MRDSDGGRNLPGMRLPGEQNVEEKNMQGCKEKSQMIETKRLVLRPFSTDDFDLIYRIYSDEAILRYTPFDPMNQKQAVCRV